LAREARLETADIRAFPDGYSDSGKAETGITLSAAKRNGPALGPPP